MVAKKRTKRSPKHYCDLKSHNSPLVIIIIIIIIIKFVWMLYSWRYLSSLTVSDHDHRGTFSEFDVNSLQSPNIYPVLAKLTCMAD